MSYIEYYYYYYYYYFCWGDRGSTVLCNKSEGRWFHASWCGIFY